MSTEKLLNTFINKATNYKVDVIDNSMLPANLKKEKQISFSISSPSLDILTKCGLILEKIPKEVRTSTDDKQFIHKSLNYTKEMAEIFCLISWGKSKSLPVWYLPFILSNVTAKEMYHLFYEISLKMQPSFFLNSIQIAEMINPMMKN